LSVKQSYRLRQIVPHAFAPNHGLVGMNGAVFSNAVIAGLDGFWWRKPGPFYT